MLKLYDDVTSGSNTFRKANPTPLTSKELPPLCGRLLPCNVGRPRIWLQWRDPAKSGPDGSRYLSLSRNFPSGRCGWLHVSDQVEISPQRFGRVILDRSSILHTWWILYMQFCLFRYLNISQLSVPEVVWGSLGVQGHPGAPPLLQGIAMASRHVEGEGRKPPRNAHFAWIVCR